mgnify:CR=1 FL=1
MRGPPRSPTRAIVRCVLFSCWPIRLWLFAGGERRDRGYGSLVGYVHLKDVLEVDPEDRRTPLDPRWIRPLPPISGEDGLRRALASMQFSGSHLARVTDVAGATVGVVALEDVLEELVGEIRDGSRRDAPDA